MNLVDGKDCVYIQFAEKLELENIPGCFMKGISLHKLFFWMLFALIFSTFSFQVQAGIQVIQQSEKGMMLEFELSELRVYPYSFDNRQYMLFLFDGGAVESHPGEPAVPVVTGRVAIPPQAQVQVDYQVLEGETQVNTDVAPLSEMYLRGEKKTVPPDPRIYERPFPFPDQVVKMGEPYLFRNVWVVPLQIAPIQYYPAEHRVELYKRLRITLRFVGGKTVVSPQPLSSYEKDIFHHKILNDQQVARFRVPVPKRLRRQAVDYNFNEGYWFQIPIEKEGVYSVSGTQLKDAGLPMGTYSVANIRMFNYGGFRLPTSVYKNRPQDLNEIAISVQDKDGNGILDEEDRILFYGKGLGGWRFDDTPGVFTWKYQSNNYDNFNYYLLTIDQHTGKRISVINSPQLSSPDQPQTFLDFFHFEVDRYNILSSGYDWYWLRFTGQSDKGTVQFHLPAHLANGPMRFEVKFKGGSGSLFGDREPYSYLFKGTINDMVIFDGVSLYRSSSTFYRLDSDSLVALKPGENEFLINYRGNLEGCEAYLDYFEIRVSRPFIAEEHQLHFRNLIGNNVPVEYRITGLDAGTNRVWDVTDLANVQEIRPLQNGSTVVFQDVSGDPKPAEYMVFSEMAVQPVSRIETIPNHPNLRNPDRRAEVIILTPDELYDAAEFLEDLRETDVTHPLEVERVRISEVFQEFSSSVRDVTAIRDFLKYVYENWSDTLKTVILFGDGHYDYRQIILKDYPNFIPPYEISNNSEVDNRETDNYYVAFGMSGSNDTIDPWVAIGRIPLNNLEQVEIYREKLLNYSHSFLQNDDKNGWQTWITLVADDQYSRDSSNEWNHVEASEEVNKKYLPEKFNRTKIYLHDYERVAGGLGRWKPKATEDLINQINRGTLIINYFGHGDPDTWAHESVLNRTRDIPKFQNVNRLPLWVAATCTWGKYDDPTHSSMSEELIWLPEKGGIAVISAARPVIAFSNEEMVKNFYRALFHNKSNLHHSRLLGDAFFLAMEGHGSRNYQKFHLFGDPTMRLADPEYIIKIESISPDTLKALSTVTVNATVRDQSLNLLQDFNGTALLQVFDAVDSLYLAPIKMHYNYRGQTIFKGLVEVKNGRITGHFIVPKSIKYKPDHTGRLSIYAWSQETDATGYVDTLLFYGTEQGIYDPEGPEIEISFKDVPEFFDGDYVSSQPTLTATIYDPSGINLTGETGHRLEIVIDGQTKKDVTEFFVYETNSYQRGKLEYTLPVLEPGNHTLKITCWDNLNNVSEREISFRTTRASELSLVEVVNYPNPFSDDTYFTFQLNAPSGSADVTISIYTVTGRKIQEIHAVAEQGFNKIYWDSRDWDGDLIANGVYLYKVIVDDGEDRVEKIEKLAIVR